MTEDGQGIENATVTNMTKDGQDSPTITTQTIGKAEVAIKVYTL